MKMFSRFGPKPIVVLTIAAFVLRLAYLLHSHPFIDEFTTVLAARSILERGLPVLPSGLFYEHGLLFSYLDAPFVGLTGEDRLFTIARLPSLFIGTASVALLYWVGRRWLSDRAGLVAAALFAFSPEGMVWGGRARMYALAQLLVLLLVFLVYEGSRGEGRPRLRWLALLVLLATLLTQFGAMILVPPLLVAGLVVGWLTRPTGVRPWFLRGAAVAESATLVAVVGLGVLIKRLGQPLGAAPLDGNGSANLLAELIGTITYQGGLALDGSSAIKFLARQFGVPHHLWLAGVAVAGVLVSLVIWLLSRSRGQLTRSNQDTKHSLLPTPPGPLARARAGYSLLYLWLAFGLTVVEMITLLESWRRNPRYLVMALPLFYLIVAASVEQIAGLKSASRRVSESASQRVSRSQTSYFTSLIPVVFLVVQAWLLIPDLRITYRTPEPAYEEAFQYVADAWQPGDVLLTMNTSGAGLYLEAKDYLPQGAYRFAIQEDASQFLLNADTQPVDRWLGAPWIGTADAFNRVLNEHPRAWFVVDTIRLPVYYRGDWLAILDSQMVSVWSEDEALVYLTRPDRTPIPTDADVPMDVHFGDTIAFNGYSLTRKDDHAADEQGGGLCGGAQAFCLKPGSNLQVTLFWQALAPVSADYTTFIHLRNEQGETVAQRDVQPFGGQYPTSQWQVGEAIAQSLDVDLPHDLPAGSYSLYIGLYRLDTMTRLPVENDSSGENALVLDETIRVISGE